MKAEAEKLAALVDRLVNPVKTIKLTPLSDLDPELLGPKMVEVPETETLPSARMDDLLDISPEAPPELHWKLRELVGCYQEAFGFDNCLGNPQVEVKIDVVLGTHPISQPMYGASSQKREIINMQINKWLEQDIIEPSKSPWVAPVVIIYRNSKPQFCVDYRKLNAGMIPDEFPIPHQTEILQALSGAQVLTMLDAIAGFNQLSITSEDQEKTGFRSHRGLHQFKQLPFSLWNGPSIFQ